MGLLSRQFCGRNPVPILAYGLLALLPLACTGCRDQFNQASIQVSGIVMFGGEPVPTGTIKFAPLSGDGSMGFAKIKDGKYDTAASERRARGIEKGRYRVEVIGFVFGQPKADGGEDGGIPNGEILFSPHRFEHEFTANETLDIVVPKK